MRVYSQNLQKQTTKIFKTGGRTPGAPVLDPPLFYKTPNKISSRRSGPGYLLVPSYRTNARDRNAIT